MIGRVFATQERKKRKTNFHQAQRCIKYPDSSGSTQAWRTDRTCAATRRRAVLNHLSQCASHWLPARDNQASGPGDNPFSSLQSLRCTSQDMRSENHCTLHPCCAQHTSLRALDSPDKARHQLRPPKLRIPIPSYTSYNTISPSYMSLPGIMTALALRTSFILVTEFHAVCRCTIRGAEADSEARIPGITMMVRVDIFTKGVTSNPQSSQPKYPNKICDSQT